MALTFSHAVGYRGICKVDGKLILCTGGSINLTQDPIMASGTWGAGYGVAAPITYAWNYLQLEGSANFELTTSGEWAKFKSFAFTNRTSQTTVVLKPDGKNGFNGNGWCSSLGFEASQSSAITGSFNFKGDPSLGGITADGGELTTANAAEVPSFVGAKLYAYWQTNVSANSKELDDIISWNCTYNSDLQLLKCCKKEDTPPKAADYILCGQMSGDASLTVFKLRGDFDPNNYHTQMKDLQFNIGNSQYIKIPYAVKNSASTSMTNGASYVTAEFSYNALGDGKNSIMTMN